MVPSPISTQEATALPRKDVVQLVVRRPIVLASSVHKCVSAWQRLALLTSTSTRWQQKFSNLSLATLGMLITVRGHMKNGLGGD